MEFRTRVDILKPSWLIEPCERMLFVGSCFADNLGKMFTDQKFRTVVNPFGVMYNPVSIGHTVSRLIEDTMLPFVAGEAGVAVFTLGTNHVYRLKATGEIVNNCQKRPQSLFQEELLSVEACAQSLIDTIDKLHGLYPQVCFMLTVSPIRYRKYGYHGSQLSKATLLLAVDKVVEHYRLQSEADGTDQVSWRNGQVGYFPAYEIVCDELRDYRFYKPDMLHPSDQAVAYIWERLSDTYFSAATLRFLDEWKPLREALSHRPFHPESPEYQSFLRQTKEKLAALKRKYPQLEVDVSSVPAEGLSAGAHPSTPSSSKG
jgi:hypothetical protein